MNLLDLMDNDNAILFEDTSCGFAHTIVLTPLSGEALTLAGEFNRTSMSTDPVSGIKFIQAKASITLVSARLSGYTLDDTWTVTVKRGSTTVFTGLIGAGPLVDDDNDITTFYLTKTEAEA